jgi:hypothetical protein
VHGPRKRTDRHVSLRHTGQNNKREKVTITIANNILGKTKETRSGHGFGFKTKSPILTLEKLLGDGMASAVHSY